MTPSLVLVTGPPGAGKTTIARALADALELPLVEKDALKELIGGSGNVAAESRLVRELPPARVVQVRVAAEPDVLRDRLLARGATRHPVHYDAEAADDIAARAAAGDWSALPVDGVLLEIDTSTRFPESRALARRIESLLRE